MMMICSAKFFHRVANNKRKFNAIDRIDVDGRFLGDASLVERAIANFGLALL